MDERDRLKLAAITFMTVLGAGVNDARLCAPGAKDPGLKLLEMMRPLFTKNGLEAIFAAVHEEPDRKFMQDMLVKLQAGVEKWT